MLLNGKTILVTGAGSGIGRGISLALSEEGARVVASDLDLASAQETAQTCNSSGQTSTAVELDVTDRDAIQRVFDGLEESGGLHGLVNNAGLLRMGPALDLGQEELTAQLAVNTEAVLTCSQAFTSRATAAGRPGVIVNVSSNAGKVGYPNMAGYNASKAAVVSLTRSLAAEWAPWNINVNAVCPGGVDTPMLDEVADWIGSKTGEAPAKLRSAMVPQQLGRHVAPLEIGRVVAFLLSDSATIIRGQSINLDGGDTPY